MRMSVVLWFLLLAIVAEIVMEVITKSCKINTKLVKRIKNLVISLFFLAGTVVGILPREWMWFFVMGMYFLRFLLSFLPRSKKRGTTINAVKKNRKWKTFIGALIITVLSFIPVLIWPGYKRIPETGDLQVVTKSYTYVDTDRVETYDNSGNARTLTVQFWYPESDQEQDPKLDQEQNKQSNQEQEYPLVVFSHGSMGIRSSNESLFYELASHGYVVCSIDHTYQCMSTTDVNGKTTRISSRFMKELQNENAKKDINNSFTCYQEWMSVRTTDIDFVLDTILKKGADQSDDKVYHMIDPEKIGVIGHSLGGSAALGIGRSRDDIKAVIALEAPFMCDIEGVSGNEFVFNEDPYPVPVLNVYSDSAWGKMKDWAQYKKNVDLLEPTEETAFNVYIKNTNHMALTDLSLSCPIMVTLFDVNLHAASYEYVLKTVNKLTLDFFDRYLKGGGTFIAYRVYEE